MNIFAVHDDPIVAASMLCDQHVVKMPVENCQMLAAVFEDEYCGHPKSVFKHPCTLWLKKSSANVNWLLMHHKATLEEYFFRYGRKHKFDDSPSHFWNLQPEDQLPSSSKTPFANATPYKDMEDTIEAYRHFYCVDKSKFARWRYTDKPAWYRPLSSAG